MELNAKSDLADVLRASQPYNMLSKTTAGVVTTLSHTIVSKSLSRLKKMGMIQEQKVAKIEKNGRPERIYRLTDAGAAWLRTIGLGSASVLPMSDPIDLAHRYCQALVGALTPFGTKVEIEKVIPLTGGRNIRFDVAVPLSNGMLQFIEVEQKLEGKNIARAIEKFKAMGELFNIEAVRGLYSPEVLFVFNLSLGSLSRTLNIWRDALGDALPGDGPLPFTPRYTTIDAFVFNPSYTDMENFPIIEKRKSDDLQEPKPSGHQLLDYRMAPSTKMLLQELQTIQDETVELISHDADQLVGFCEIAMMLYRKSMHRDSPTRKYSAFPHESVQALRQFLHIPQNAGLLQVLKEGYTWIESRKSGLILYRDAVTKLVWDVVLRYFGFGREGPLNVFVGIPDLGEKSSQLTIEVYLSKDEIELSTTSTEESYEDAISWTLTALIMYPVDLGLASSLWSPTKRKGE